ncbi:hypothetical protein NHQ30_008433 [Ciborinia camelliae]|nr:hypothetical protein NHQ30_008433 [Ciborinia camelliae]
MANYNRCMALNHCEEPMVLGHGKEPYQHCNNNEKPLEWRKNSEKPLEWRKNSEKPLECRKKSEKPLEWRKNSEKPLEWRKNMQGHQHAGTNTQSRCPRDKPQGQVIKNPLILAQLLNGIIVWGYPPTPDEDNKSPPKPFICCRSSEDHTCRERELNQGGYNHPFLVLDHYQTRENGEEGDIILEIVPKPLLKLEAGETSRQLYIEVNHIYRVSVKQLHRYDSKCSKQYARLDKESYNAVRGIFGLNYDEEIFGKRVRTPESTQATTRLDRAPFVGRAVSNPHAFDFKPSMPSSKAEARSSYFSNSKVDLSPLPKSSTICKLAEASSNYASSSEVDLSPLPNLHLPACPDYRRHCATRKYAKYDTANLRMAHVRSGLRTF